MINVGIVGIGSMGRNHARVLAQMPEVNLAALADVDEATVNQIARTYKANAYTDYRQMLETEHLDVVTVAVPTSMHLEVTLAAIAHGAHVLVEKPLAFSVAECQQMIDAATARNVRLAVGHIERFNPAILELKRRLRTGELGRVFQIRSRRVGPFPSRIADVGVVFDLATHELYIMEYLIGAPIQSL
jgi:predicted dehydrogenase